MAGKDWVRGFLSRHTQLSIRTPEATSAARARGFNKPVVFKFFDVLERLMEEHRFPPNRIYNVDETGMTTVQSRPSKILALKGRRQVGSITSAERGQLVTVEICMSATGTFIPPLFIFPRQRMKAELMDGAPNGAIYACHKSGWMQTDIFFQWFQHFVGVSGATKDNPVLLILDGHSTHTTNIELINYARDNGVHIVCLPAHCSHRLQPLDVSFMKPLSTYYTQAIESWLRNHPGRTVTVFLVAKLFNEAYLKAATALVAANGFRKTGIYPMNRHVFEDYEFAPAAVTDKDRPKEGNQEVNNADLPENSQSADRPISHKDSSSEDNIPDDNSQHPSDPDHAAPNLVIEDSTCEENSTNPPGDNHDNIANVVSSESSLRTYTSQVIPTDDQVPGTSHGYVSPLEISPPPKIPAVSTEPQRRKRSAASSAQLITSSPYKKLLDDAAAAKLKKASEIEERKRLREERKKRNEKGKSKKGQGKDRNTKTRTKQVTKETSSDESSGEDSGGEKYVCFFCNEEYSRASIDGWIQCTSCLKWAHDQCAGVDSGDDEYTCDICT